MRLVADMKVKITKNKYNPIYQDSKEEEWHDPISDARNFMATQQGRADRNTCTGYRVTKNIQSAFYSMVKVYFFPNQEKSYLYSLLTFDIVLEILHTETGQEKKCHDVTGFQQSSLSYDTKGTEG